LRNFNTLEAIIHAPNTHETKLSATWIETGILTI